MMIEALLEELHGVRSSGSGYTALCPAHEDHKNSLEVKQKPGSKITIKCHAGCSGKEIMGAVGLTLRDLYPDGSRRNNGNHSEIVAEYDYRDAAGKLLFQKVRYEPKDFRLRRPDIDGGWIWNLKGVRTVLYRLREVLAAIEAGRTIHLCEGEKDADHLVEQGLDSTTWVEGAGKGKPKWKPHYTKTLEGARLVLLPDRDDAGKVSMQGIARALHGAASEIKIVELPNLKTKGDVSDWLDGGGTVEALAELVKVAPVFDTKTIEATPEPEATPSGPVEGFPKVFLPGGARNIRITDAATELGKLFSNKEMLFARGGSVVRVNVNAEGGAVIESVGPAALASIFESVADLYTTVPKNNSIVEAPKNCSKTSAEAIASCLAFVEELPPLRLLTRCPVLTVHEGRLETIDGYHRPTGIFAAGGAVEDISLEDARGLLDDMLHDFRFASPADRSRALAGLITPVLIHGRLLGARAPLDLGEADESQAGKGFRARLAAAIYNDTPRTITQRQGGVGSLDESFSAALIRGAAFISLDNVHGKLGSPAIESALTEESFMAREPYGSLVEIDMSRIIVMLTSNRAEITQDLANRSSPVLIRKQPEGYRFKVYPGGADILEHVRKNQGRYLGAVFAVVRAWWEADCPRTSETRHDFRAWAQALDWIVQNLLGEAPLCDGIKEIKARMTTPSLGWLREVALFVTHGDYSGEWLRASDIIDILDANGAEIPGLPENGDLADRGARKKALLAVGRRLSQCFKTATRPRSEDAEFAVLTIDAIRIERATEHDQVNRQEARSYRFAIAATESGYIAADAQNDGSRPPSMGQNQQSDTVGIAACGYGAAMDAAMKSPAASIAANGSKHNTGPVSTAQSDGQNREFGKSMGPIAAQPQNALQEPEILGKTGPVGGEAVVSGSSQEREVFEL